MVQNEVDQTLRGNIEKNVSTNYDSNDYHKNRKLDMGEDDQYMYDTKVLNIEENIMENKILKNDLRVCLEENLRIFMI